MMNNQSYGHIPSEEFKFVQADARIFDQKLETKPIGYMKDAWYRFRKNKASIVAAVIIIMLLLYALIVPVFSKYNLGDRDLYYKKALPKSSLISKLGFWDGTTSSGQSEAGFSRLYGMNIEIESSKKSDYASIRKYTSEIAGDGKEYYTCKIDTYLQVGYQFMNLTLEEYEAILKYQDESNDQVLYPMINVNATFYRNQYLLGGGAQDANCWYYTISNKGLPNQSPTIRDNSDLKTEEDIAKLKCYTETIAGPNGDKEVKYYANYITRSLNPDAVENDYSSKRIEGDPGITDPTSGEAYVYAAKNQSGYKVRVSYYDYYKYLHGFEASFFFGSNSYGQDIFVALAIGARFSFLLAICVSAINLVIGAIYGSIEGYYGGALDLFMERISDILSGVPFIVVATLFQLHLATKVGPVVSLLFAFVLTGWIGIASRVRSQFYRFKGQEYVLAARTLGASDGRLIFRHIFPNSLGTIITSCVLIIPGVIFSESSLSFLGIIDLHSATLTSVGTLLSDGNAAFPNFPHIVLFPAIFISLLEISFNMFGNGLRDAFNPSLRGAEE